MTEMKRPLAVYSDLSGLITCKKCSATYQFKGSVYRHPYRRGCPDSSQSFEARGLSCMLHALLFDALKGARIGRWRDGQLDALLREASARERVLLMAGRQLQRLAALSFSELSTAAATREVRVAFEAWSRKWSLCTVSTYLVQGLIVEGMVSLHDQLLRHPRLHFRLKRIKSIYKTMKETRERFCIADGQDQRRAIYSAVLKECWVRDGVLRTTWMNNVSHKVSVRNPTKQLAKDLWAVREWEEFSTKFGDRHISPAPVRRSQGLIPVGWLEHWGEGWIDGPPYLASSISENWHREGYAS